MRTISTAIFISFLALTAPLVAENRVVQLEGTDLGLPFSPGVLAGDFLFLSGAIGNKPGVAAVEGDVAAQTRQTMANLKSVLDAAGLDYSRVVTSTSFVSDARLGPALGQTIGAMDLKILPPAATGVEADIAIVGAMLEMSAIAARKGVEIRAITPEGWPKPSMDYSWGALAGDVLFIAGQVGVDPKTDGAAPDVASQVRRALANVEAVARAAGLGIENVVTCRVYLADARNFGTMNEVWRSVFTSKPPSRATVRARLLDPRLEVEIQCIAARGEKKVIVAAGDSAEGRPFSPAIQVGDLVYTSGFVGRGADGYPHSVADQTGVVLDRLAATLKGAGMSFEDVVNAEVWISDVRHYAEMNKVYAARMPKPPPARATVGAQLMSPDALVEIAMIAVRSAEGSE